MVGKDRFTVLVMGGSQGARMLNEVVPEALSAAARRGVAIQAIHIAGKNDESRVADAYARAGVPALVFGFLEQMGKAYCSADIAVCRSGGATCAELIACRLPALLIPLPGAPGDHQTANAMAMVCIGGASIMHQCDLSAERLAEYLAEMISNSSRLCSMRRALGGVNAEGAASGLADMVEREVRRADI